MTRLGRQGSDTIAAEGLRASRQGDNYADGAAGEHFHFGGMRFSLRCNQPERFCISGGSTKIVDFYGLTSASGGSKRFGQEAFAKFVGRKFEVVVDLFLETFDSPSL